MTWDKREAAAQMVEERFPLYTQEIREAVDAVHREIGAPAPVFRGVLEIVKRYPDHFADRMAAKSDNYRKKGNLVWVNPENGHEFDDVLIEIVEKYLYVCIKLKIRLMEKPHDVFYALYDEYLKRRRISSDVAGDLFDEKCFYSLPHAFMNLEKWAYWLSLESWTEDEAVALSLSRDPDIVSMSTVRQVAGDASRSTFLNAYAQRTRRINRAVASSPALLEPTKFVPWASEALNGSILNAFSVWVSQPSKNPDLDIEEISPKARKTLRLLILCMAVDKYGHKLDGNSPATSRIYDAFISLGLKIDQSTIRDVLTQAATDEKLEDEVEEIRGALRDRARS